MFTFTVLHGVFMLAALFKTLGVTGNTVTLNQAMQLRNELLFAGYTLANNSLRNNCSVYIKRGETPIHFNIGVINGEPCVLIKAG